MRALVEGDARQPAGQRRAPSSPRRGRRTAAGRRGAARAGRRRRSGGARACTSSWATKAVGLSSTASRDAPRRPHGSACGPIDDADAAVAAARLDHELVERPALARRTSGRREVVGRHGGQQRLLVEVEAHHVLDVGVEELVVGHAGAERVDEPERARARHGSSSSSPDRRSSSAVLVRAPVDDVDGARVAARRSRPSRTRARRDRRARVGRRHWCSQKAELSRAVGEQRRSAGRPSARASAGARARRVAAAAGEAVERPRRSAGRRRAAAASAPRGRRPRRRARRRAHVVLEHLEAARRRRARGRGRRCRSTRRPAGARRASRARSSRACRSRARARRPPRRCAGSP